MAKINTQDELKEYILRALGKPVICVELAHEQIIDRICDAMDRYFERHYDGVDERVYFLNVKKGEQNYTMPDEVVAVLSMFQQNAFLNEEPLLRQEPMVTSNFSTMSGMVDLPQFEVWLQAYQMTVDYFDNSYLFDFNGTTKKIHFFRKPAKNEKVALKVYTSTEGQNIFNNWWLKQYATALCGIQWAVNVGKYSGAPLPGGAEVNWSDIYQRYSEMKEKLEEQLKDEFSEPPEFFFG